MDSIYRRHRAPSVQPSGPRMDAVATSGLVRQRAGGRTLSAFVRDQPAGTLAPPPRGVVPFGPGTGDALRLSRTVRTLTTWRSSNNSIISSTAMEVRRPGRRRFPFSPSVQSATVFTDSRTWMWYLPKASILIARMLPLSSTIFSSICLCPTTRGYVVIALVCLHSG